ncbi:head maturation protease, ClpP-related [Megasphaera stantonii]|uniref:head maturation protease, ClpP-related n=1 Tax=Megasphaera stantonii TaxID=2144175 RepID=UPI00195E1F07|nr:head maturation protease, ClpP-related [Megasphaera stantonii]MBM6732898.1 Clp protease ClpP [Megasphaera stantonii]
MPSKFWQVKNEVNGNSEILLYGPIAGESSWWGDEVTPRSFAEDLENLGGKDVTVRINSGGGDVFAAHAIHNQLVAYKGRVTVVIDGLAASAATIIAVAGDRIIMPANALFMIHNPAIGLSDYYGAEELLKAAEALNTIKGSIVAAYRKRCKASAEELVAMMDAETWMGAAECLEKGFVDEIQGSVSPVLNGSSLVVNSVNFNIKNFKNQDALKACLNKKVEVKSMNNKLEAFLNGLGLKLVDENQPTVPVQNVASQLPAVDAEQIAKNAVEAERQRVAALEALDSGDNPAVTAIIAEAKKNGKTADDVKTYVDAVKTVPVVQDAAQQLVADMIGDNKASGVEGIGTGAVDEAALEKAADAKAMDAMAQVMNKKFGGVK